MTLKIKKDSSFHHGQQKGSINQSILFRQCISYNTVNVVIFAGGKFREIVGKTFHVGVIFTILLIFPS